MHSLWAPTLDNACEQYLFGVVGNESNEVVDDTSEMSVRTSADDGCLHPRLKWRENGGEGSVKQFVFENLEAQTVVVPTVT